MTDADEVDGHPRVADPLPRPSGSVVAVAVFGWVVEIVLALPLFTAQMYGPTYPLALATILVGCLTASGALILVLLGTGARSGIAGLVVVAMWAWLAISSAVILALAVDVGPGAFRAIWAGDLPPSEPTGVGFPSPTALLAIALLTGFVLSFALGFYCLYQLPVAIWRAARPSGFKTIRRAAGVGVGGAVAALIFASLAWVDPTSPFAGAVLLAPFILAPVVYRLGGSYQAPATSLPGSET